MKAKRVLRAFLRYLKLLISAHISENVDSLVSTHSKGRTERLLALLGANGNSHHLAHN